MNRIECIHFDLDSVLYIPDEFLETALSMSIRAMIRTGLRAGGEEALGALKKIRSENANGKDHFDRLCRHFNQPDDPLIVAAGVEKYWDCKIGMMTSAPEANLVLGRLRHRYPLAVVTNGPPVKQAGKLIRLGLDPFFSSGDPGMRPGRHWFYATEDRRRQKPNPYLWRKAKQDMGYRFSRAVMVGDRYWHDILGANRLGMITIKIDQGQHAKETPREALAAFLPQGEAKAPLTAGLTRRQILDLMQPDHTIRHLGDLEAAVEKAEERLGAA